MLSPSRSPSSPAAVSKKRPAEDDDDSEQTASAPVQTAVASPTPPTASAAAHHQLLLSATPAPTHSQSPPTKKVLERNQACLGCRARKRKCDGGKPSCGACERLDRECQYTHNAVTKIHSSSHYRGTRVSRSRRPATGTNSRPAAQNGASSSHHGSSHARRPSPTNRAVDSASPVTSLTRVGVSPVPTARGSDHYGHASTGFTAVNTSGDQASGRSHLSPGPHISNLSNGHYRHTSNQSNRGYSPYGGSSVNGGSDGLNFNNMHFFHMAPFPEFTIDLSQISAEKVDSDTVMSEDLPAMNKETDLPSPSDMAELFETFFDKIHIFLPCLYRKKVMESLKNDGEFAQPTGLTFAILAIAGYVHPNPSFKEASKQVWERNAKKAFQSAVTTGRFSHSAVQGGIYTSLLMYTQGNLGEFWVFLGSVWRMCLPLGLHHLDNPEASLRGTMPLAKNEQELEERRRTMWAVYILDRLVSVSVNWTMNIIDDEFDVNFPVSEEVFQSGSIGGVSHMIVDPFPRSVETLVPKRSEHAVQDLDAYQYLCKVAVLIGKINSYNRSFAQKQADYDDIDRALTQFNFALPKSLRQRMADLPANQLPIAFLLNVLLSTARIYLAHPRVPKSRPTDDDEAFSQCSNSVRGILNLARTASMTLHTYDLALTNPFLPCPIWFAARILGVTLLEQRLEAPAPHDHTPDSKMTRENMEILLQIIQRQEEVWPKLGKKFGEMLLADMRRDPAELSRIRSGAGYYERGAYGSN
ncbi:hypothetical protein EDC01DRAFT_619439 [Geopyxis carbonaria]|nr:hypothetical protein EDC01DRAFT_619439 [Geopyxis carbonaria]